MSIDRVARCCAVLLAMLLITPATAAQQASPVTVVERLHDTLLKVMRNADRLGFQGRLRELQPALDAAYDFQQMSRIAAGSFWKQFSPQQQQEVAQAFGRMSTATYAARFDGYAGEEFVTTGTKEAPGGGTVVQTELTRQGKEPVKLDYLVKQTGQGWQIVDVFYMGGISEVANQRSQFLSVLKNGGYEQLVAALNQKADQQAAAR